MTAFYGTQFTKTRDGSRDMIDVGKWKGRVRLCTDTYDVVGATVGLNDTCALAKIPSHAVILPQSQFSLSATLGAATTVSLGAASAANALVNAEASTATFTVSAMKAVSIANVGKKLWEVLGYSSDPGGEIDLFVTFNVDPTANATLTLTLLYVVD